ncbi:hypothetical protein SeMB42_g04399 [Synchytrium endobioticum]|uniref:Elongator complex protein 4 n=1 Tax=Synchytrium endobioticum TaxID=286115 RepID=A0A507CYM0_9FUNG|nr:hypothetical protein SeLEV6574_g05710 [Synchytrium endobioticum]TPX44272.1 hypothetical protein SeMB42_g04399 [Synchytrium endobioticum]
MSSFKSFRRKSTSGTTGTTTSNANSIPGIRPYVSSVPGYMTSTGIPTLDNIIGPGGIPLGTCTVIKEDVLTGYARLLLDYVIAQGLACGHHVCHVVSTGDHGGRLDHVMGLSENHSVARSNSADSSADDTSASSAEMDETHTVSGHDEKMKIAWRYETLPKLDNSSVATPSSLNGQSNSIVDNQTAYHRVFDLTKTYSQQTIQEMTQDGRISIINAKETVRKMGFDGVLAEIKSVVEKFKNASTPNVLRLIIRSLGSPMWYSVDDSYAIALYKFIISLKSLMRPLNAVCVISIPAYMYKDSITSPHWLIRRLEWAADAVMEIESFAGTTRTLPPIMTSTYHGLIHPQKRFSVYVPDPELKLSTFAFKCRRRKFDIQVFYLPPEEGGSDRPESAKCSGSSGGIKKKSVKFGIVEKEGGRSVRFSDF